MGLDARIGRALPVARARLRRLLLPVPGAGAAGAGASRYGVRHAAHRGGRALEPSAGRLDHRPPGAGRGPPLAGARVALLGLTFKAGTDDLRESPALRLAEVLVRAGRARWPRSTRSRPTAVSPQLAREGVDRASAAPPPRRPCAGADAVVVAHGVARVPAARLGGASRRRMRGRVIADARPRGRRRAGDRAAGLLVVTLGVAHVPCAATASEPLAVRSWPRRPSSSTPIVTALPLTGQRRGGRRHSPAGRPGEPAAAARLPRPGRARLRAGGVVRPRRGCTSAARRMSTARPVPRGRGRRGEPHRHPRRGRRAARLPQRVPPSRLADLHRARGPPGPLPVPVPRLDLRAGRSAAARQPHRGAGRLRAGRQRARARPGSTTWQGFVFVIARPRRTADLAAIHGRPVGAHRRASRWPTCGARAASSTRWRANWKVIGENYSECYHCPGVHPAAQPADALRPGPQPRVERAWCGGWMELRDDVDTMSVDGLRHGRPPLAGHQRRRTSGASTTSWSGPTCC